jgi:hypothetical protein
MRSTPLTRFLFIVGVVYIVLAVAAVVLAFSWTFGGGGSSDEATKIAAVWVSLLTGALGAIASLSVAFVQRENNRILADVQGKVAQRLETRKVQISAEQKAYDELSAAASYYYYAVKQIEYEQYEKAQVKRAEAGMVAACRYLFAVSEVDKRTWFRIWQWCRYLAREVAPKGAGERIRLYEEKIKGLDESYEAFFQAARKHHLAEEES